MECEFPTVNSNKDEIKAIFEETKTIAIVGLSPDKEKASYRMRFWVKKFIEVCLKYLLILILLIFLESLML